MFSTEENRKIYLSCVDPKIFRKLCQMMHLRIAHHLKFKLDDAREAKFKSPKLRLTASLARRARIISTHKWKKAVRDIKIKESKLPILSPKHNLLADKMNIWVEGFRNK